MAKPRKPKIRFDFVPASLRDRLDMDYLGQLDELAHKYLKKFVEEIYGRKFQKDALLRTKRDRQEVYHDTYASREDVYNVCVRVHLDPTIVEMRPLDVQEKLPVKEIEIKPEIERVYEENGIKITRFKPVKS